MFWRPVHGAGRYALSLRPSRTADNNKNKSAPWQGSSNDRRAQRVGEIRPHPGFSHLFPTIHLSVSTNALQGAKEQRISNLLPPNGSSLAGSLASSRVCGLVLEESTKTFSQSCFYRSGSHPKIPRLKSPSTFRLSISVNRNLRKKDSEQKVGI